MNQLALWRSAFVANLLAFHPMMLLLSSGAPFYPTRLVQGTLLISGPILALFGVLLVLYSLQSAGVMPRRNFVAGVLFCLFLASLGAIGTGVQMLIAMLAGGSSLALLIAGAISGVVVGAFGLSSQAVTRLPSIKLLLLGGGLILFGFFITLAQIALLLFPLPV